MKMFAMVLILILIMISSAFAQEVVLSDFNNWKMTDVSSKGFTKEDLFKQMNTKLMNTGTSICSNRALVWAYDFKRKQDIDAGKLFVYYAKKSGWWYHVTPVINEKGTIFAMDAGFPEGIKSPITTSTWLKAFTGSNNCKEIKATDTDLIKRMFDGYLFPKTTSHGTFDCYYIITPGGYWTPSSVAKGLLGLDEEGHPVQFERDQIDNDELLTACVEAMTTPLGRVFGGQNRCDKYLGIP